MGWVVLLGVVVTLASIAWAIQRQVCVPVARSGRVITSREASQAQAALNGTPWVGKR